MLREHDILLILDEVITASAGSATGSALSVSVSVRLRRHRQGDQSGYFPFGAVLIGDRPMELLDGRMLRHGFTYNGHPVGAAVAIENLAIIERENLLDAVRKRGEQLGNRLSRLEEREVVAEVRGAGLMWGIELTAGRRGRAGESHSRARRDRPGP